MSRVANQHFGGWLDDIWKSATTPSPTTTAQQTAPVVPPTESFFVKHSGLVIGATTVDAMAKTLIILNNKKKNL